VKKTIFAVMLCVLTAAVLCACAPPADTVDTTPAATVPASSTAAPTDDLTPVPSATPATTPAGVTENKLGFVTDAYVTGGTNYIKIDYVDMYTGDEAIAKALADGSNLVETDENGIQFIPNDYYIRNINKLIRTFPLSTGCTIDLLDHNDPSVTINATFSDLQARLNEEPLMHINVVNGSVVSMTQQYLP